MDGTGLTHVDEHGAARMVDVTAKDVTVREATARGRLETTAEVVGLLARDGLPKGDADDVTITATTRTADRTGVEMEALTAVAGAALALYDMVKAVDRAARITDVELVHKSGGRRGEWSRDV